MEVAHKRAILPDGPFGEFVLIARDYIVKIGAERTQRLVTIPA